jgi:hypothetical protein
MAESMAQLRASPGLHRGLDLAKTFPGKHFLIRLFKVSEA